MQKRASNLPRFAPPPVCHEGLQKQALVVLTSEQLTSSIFAIFACNEKPTKQNLCQRNSWRPMASAGVFHQKPTKTFSFLACFTRTPPLPTKHLRQFVAGRGQKQTPHSSRCAPPPPRPLFSTKAGKTAAILVAGSEAKLNLQGFVEFTPKPKIKDRNLRKY